MVTDTNVTITLRAVTCYKTDCAIVFGLNSRHQEKLRENHATFYCPNGHAQGYYSKSEEEKLREQLAETRELRDRAWQENSSLRKTADYAKRVAKRRKTELKKVTARVAHGICPCCNRTFKQLAAHMKLKHPDHVAKVDLELKKEDHE